MILYDIQPVSIRSGHGLTGLTRRFKKNSDEQYTLKSSTNNVFLTITK